MELLHIKGSLHLTVKKKKKKSYLHSLSPNDNTFKLDFILVNTYANSRIRMSRFIQRNRSEELKTAIVAEFQRLDDAPIFCETGGNVTVIVFESNNDNWSEIAAAVRDAVNTHF